jgi:RIO kinase 1
MPRVNPHLLVDDEFDMAVLDRRAHREKVSKSGRKAGKPRQADPDPAALAAQQEREERFEFSYQASRHEQQWIEDSLGGFYEDHMIADVLRLVRGGKEATVYLCAGDPSTIPERHVCAKVYRPRMFRNLRKDHLYREGRVDLDADGNEIKNHGMQHAMRKRTAYGQELLHGSWIEYEYQTLVALHAAGVEVPRPYGRGTNAILMTYLGDAHTPAPTLNTIRLERDEAQPLFERVVRNVDLMLANERIHGDLSAFNILYWQGDIWLIDFPQVMQPRQNRLAYTVFERDLLRVCEYFIRQGARCAPRRLAAELWTSHGYSLKPDVHPSLLDEEDEADRRLWASFQDSQS